MSLAMFETMQVQSLRDRKTLTQKALKLCEETGELAQVILPLEGAYGTTYKKANLGQVLEEGCDVAIVALSIMYSAGFTTEQIFAEMAKKMVKWGSVMDLSDQHEQSSK